MIEVIVTAKFLNTAEADMIGIKDALAAVVEKWSDLISIDVRSSAPLQLTLDGIRPKLTAAAAMEEIKKHNLTLEEMRNMIQAVIELNKIECKTQENQ